jgi:poly(ADP-ribose) glycohydrolase ARH3
VGPDIKSKFLGAMLGSALGDAVGELAFSNPLLNPLLEQIERLAQLEYTDDTAMTMGLAESIAEKGCVVEGHLGDTFARNFEREPWRGYASGPPTVFAVVQREGISYPDAAGRLFGGSGSFGNGAAMRIAPVGLFFCTSEHLYDHACRSARVTHSHPVGMDGAAVQALAVAQALTWDPTQDFSWQAFLHRLIGASRTAEIREKMKRVEEMIADEVPPEQAVLETGPSVAVQESMPFAVYAFLRHRSSYEECILCATLNGGDRDTLGAMAGAISGAYLGVEAIPENWLCKMENLDILKDLALLLLERFSTALP